MSLTAALLAVALPRAVMAQPCLHGGSLTENTFSTNCIGQIVFGKTHVGSTVGVLIRANMVDDCPGDQTLITNLVDRIDFNSTTSFTTTNLLTHPVLLPSLGATSNIVNVVSGPFAGSAYTFIVPANSAQVITNTATQLARDTNSATNPNGLLGGVGSAQILVLRPAITVTKICTNGVGENGLIGFSGTVSNAGDVVLTNVFVFNNQPSNNTPVLGPITLNVGQSVPFSGSYRPPSACAPATDILSAFGTDELLCTVSSTATQTCSLITTPCINVTKVCSTNLLVLCGSTPGAITFSGTVSNCGNITLTNVTVRDSLVGNAVVLGPVTLAPGASLPWSTNLSVGAAFCGQSNILNTATARGTDCLNRSVTNTASCSFTVICPAPQITISKGCASPVVTNIGSSLTVTGQVCNTGNIPFTSVIVVDTQPGLPVSATNNLGTLEPGQCKPYSFTYTTTTCAPNVDTVRVFGTSACGTASATNTATCYLCCPAIAIEKYVACVLPGGACPAFPGAAYNITATGYRGNTGDPAQDNPGFCYAIVVRNTGQDSLTNIVVSDPRLGVNQTFPGPLVSGSTIVISGLRTNWATTTTNVATVTARCAGSAAGGGVNGNGASVSATTNAVAIVIPADIECRKLVSVNGSAPVANYNATDCTSETNVVIWYAVVTNTGSVTLTNIQIVELGTGPDLLPCGAVNLLLNGSLAPGQGTQLIPLCTNTFGCVDTNINNSIRVLAHIAASGSTQCVYNASGTNIMVESDCRASMTLCCTPPGLGCRVTGGGRQDDPDVCPDNVRYVTHGGQVGAPVGNSNCVVTLANVVGNPCIHGRWTHVRHTQGGLEGNFHARYFDTLQCACLSTNLAANGLWSAGTVEEGRCNPGDRIAGPEPRKAPANKIVFTGVGDWADPNGRREPRSVLFRVDIEDRSEPGGFHPGGQKDPADRYRIRIWVLTQAEANRLNNPADGLLDLRNAISACNGLLYRDGVDASQLDNACGGTGTITFPGGAAIRRPDIDDGGALKHGNHQIHPQIKPCDPLNPTGPGLPPH